MPVSLGLTTCTLATCGARIRAISPALPVISSATRSLGARLAANSSSACGVVSIRPTTRTRPACAIATTQKSRCTSIPIALNTPHLLVVDARELRWANDTDGFVLAAQPGQSQGRPVHTPGSRPISRGTACPAWVLPEAPVPVARRYAADRTAGLRGQFHARNTDPPGPVEK